ncbi:MAG TPA: hypothetical protein VN791_07210 [Acidimicrobiales bacterium]|nr:hypothetical protein [Acidimicrobiales bacterium]
MLRKVILSAGVVALCAGLLVVVSAVPASAAPPATGTVLCGVTIGGGGAVHPGLTTAGSAGGVKISFSAKLSTGNCSSHVTSPSGVVVTGGHLTGSGSYGTNVGSSCANFDGPDTVGKITVVIHWTTTGGSIANTKVTYKLNLGTTSGFPTDTIDLVAPSGTAHKSAASSFFTLPTVGPNETKLVTNLPAPGSPGCTAVPFVNFQITGGDVDM